MSICLKTGYIGLHRIMIFLKLLPMYYVLLLYKLDKIGYFHRLIILFHNYLFIRKHSLLMGSSLQNLPQKFWGPQGSKLRPLLFSIFINNVGLYINFVNIFLFAYDIKLYTRITTKEESICLQIDTDCIV